MSDCDHPSIRVYGNPDPFEGRVRGNVAKKLTCDAECEECGQPVKVDYAFDGIQEGPR